MHQMMKQDMTFGDENSINSEDLAKSWGRKRSMSNKMQLLTPMYCPSPTQGIMN